MEDTLEKILAKVEKIDSRFDKVDQRLEQMDSKFDKVDQRLEQVNKDISHIKSQQKENTAILRALEHANEVNKAELDKLNINVAKLSGKTERVQSRAETALN